MYFFLKYIISNNLINISDKSSSESSTQSRELNQDNSNTQGQNLDDISSTITPIQNEQLDDLVKDLYSTSPSFFDNILSQCCISGDNDSTSNSVHSEQQNSEDKILDIDNVVSVLNISYIFMSLLF